MYLIFTKNFTKGYNMCMRYLQDIIGHPKELEIKKRVKVIDFFDKYGLSATKEAIKPALDEYCKENDIESVLESTIGSVIKDLKELGMLMEG